MTYEESLRDIGVPSAPQGESDVHPANLPGGEVEQDQQQDSPDDPTNWRRKSGAITHPESPICQNAEQQHHD
jgi:hypothetical protein